MRNILASVSLLLAACGGGDDGADATFVAWGSSTSTITLAWEPVAGATGYQLERVGGETVSLDAGQVTYLDRELAEGMYAYRLTALGVDDPVQTTDAATSADPAVITVDDAPIGEPVVATIGSAGGTIELPDGSARAIIPAGALPDGATVTLQQITPPTGPDVPDLAVEVSTDPAASQPIELSFALGEEDLADPANVAVADKQIDGTWVMQAARLDGDRAVITTSPAADTLWAAGRGRSRGVRLRRIRIQPEQLYVKAGTTHVLSAVAIYSDDHCQEDYVNIYCEPSVPRPIVQRRPLENRVGRWTTDGPGRLLVEPAHTTITYVAPDSRPSQERWTITFTHNNGRSSWAQVRFIRDVFLLKFEYDNTGDDIGYFLGGTTHDEFSLIAEAKPDGSMTMTSSGVTNTASMVTNTYPLDPAVAASMTTPFELVTVTGAAMDHRNGSFTGIFPGTSTSAGTTVTFQGGTTQSFPGGTGDTTLTLIVPEIDFSQITDERLFAVPYTHWYLRVTPSAGP